MEYRAEDWDAYRMDYDRPHAELEPLDDEVSVVGQALACLQQQGVIPSVQYDMSRMLAHRVAVREAFDIPWTAISPRVQRLLYAVNAIAKPRNMIAAGIFCGFTFISNAGSAVGPGACYEADDLVGVEIDEARAALAARNVALLDSSGKARIVAQDAVKFVAGFQGSIDLLYLDADGSEEQGKGVYLDILEAAYSRIPKGGIVIAHNSVNCSERLKHYLSFVRDPEKLRSSVNVIVDPEGVEISVR